MPDYLIRYNVLGEDGVTQPSKSTISASDAKAAVAIFLSPIFNEGREENEGMPSFSLRKSDERDEYHSLCWNGSGEHDRWAYWHGIHSQERGADYVRITVERLVHITVTAGAAGFLHGAAMSRCYDGEIMRTSPSSHDAIVALRTAFEEAGDGL